MTPKRLRDQQARARCVELILDYGSEPGNGPFLREIISGYVSRLLTDDVDRLVSLLDRETPCGR